VLCGARRHPRPRPTRGPTRGTPRQQRANPAHRPYLTGVWLYPGCPPPDPDCALHLSFAPAPGGQIAPALYADHPAIPDTTTLIAAWPALPAGTWLEHLVPTLTAHPWTRHHGHRAEHPADLLARLALAYLLTT